MSHTALTQAIKLCQELVNLLNQENTFIRQHDMAAIEAGTARKEILAEDFQATLKAIKTDLSAIKSNPALHGLHAQLKELLLAYNEAARRNVVMLQAGHTSATSFINIVRQAIQPPAPQVYGKNGQICENTGHSVPLLAKSV